MMLGMEGARKEKKGLDFLFFYFNLVNLLKLLVATAHVDCTAYASVSNFAYYIQLLSVKRLIAYE